MQSALKPKSACRKEIPTERPSRLEQFAPWLGGVFTFAVLVGYTVNFQALSISKDPGNWGAFGDYVGGLLNPLFGFFTLLVALRVLRLQRSELRDTKTALEKSNQVADSQFQLALRTQAEAIYISCRDDITRSIEVAAAAFTQSTISPMEKVNELSRLLEKEQPLVGLNSHAVSFSLKASGYESPLPLPEWDWSISHGNNAREILRQLLPLCRAIGDALVAISLMPPELQGEKFKRLRNSQGEWTLSTFAYFLVLHPDGAQYHSAAAEGNVLANLRIQRARSFAQAYLPNATYTTR